LTDVVLFHHAQGLTPGVQRFADDLRRGGHRVLVPDLFEGKTFDVLEAGFGYVEDVGFGTFLERGRRAVEGMPGGLVYVGFSLGVLPAQMLAQTRPGAAGALFAHACIPISEFGGKWPPGVPVQIHAMEADPYFVAEGDLEAARTLVEMTDEAELFLYPGDQHLFADEGLSSYDPAAATLLIDRALEFLDRFS
jgi:dienelactone hydrolase